MVKPQENHRKHETPQQNGETIGKPLEMVIYIIAKHDDLDRKTIGKWWFKTSKVNIVIQWNLELFYDSFCW